LNALAAVNAERYYRSMVRGGPDSWNIRDRHMVEVLNRLVAFHGSEAKAIVWEHNTHIGDARATDMAQEGMVNVGQLLREQHAAKQVFAVGFGTHRGTVIAADAWGAPLEIMKVPAAIKGSWEDLFHQAGEHDQLFIFDPDRTDPFGQVCGHRAIGVVYDPKRERGNYVPTNLAQRYDAFIYVEESHALQPFALEMELSHSDR
jgi:erythromycin esterase-like protein